MQESTKRLLIGGSTLGALGLALALGSIATTNVARKDYGLVMENKEDATRFWQLFNACAKANVELADAAFDPMLHRDDQFYKCQGFTVAVRNAPGDFASFYVNDPAAVSEAGVTVPSNPFRLKPKR